eukprot:TRINITY_DN2102_c0_g1_i1.p1 TRINITY_DN2102_c0_g1~~TRINITY_DN2102_c0_g1_i1.p1  ORF type:complete len:360 (-),score=78.41 TRINITY_DN2102_c0_g1_i1:71-1123(-)
MGKCFSSDFPLIKVVILGTSGSGKSTFTQQLKIINMIDFSVEHRMAYNDLLLKNILYGIREVCVNVVELELPVKEKNRRNVRYFNESDAFLLDIQDQDIWVKVKSLWRDQKFVAAWQYSKTMHTQISQMDFLMDNLDRYLDPENVPNDEDILRSRQRTTGAYSTRFTDGDHMFEITDVGGQKPERRKWHELLNNGVKSIIFFSALDEYDIDSIEEKDKTKLEVSMDVFSELVNDEEFQELLIIVFFNKFDLFKEKIVTEEGYNSWCERFPDYEKQAATYKTNKQASDEENLWDSCIKYLEEVFRERCEIVDKVLFFHPTTAIDRDKTEVVFESVKMKLTLDKLSNAGFNL